MIDEEPAPRSGQVTLVGGGPGRTSLLTLEACAALRQADVVFFDRLAPAKDLDELAAGAELVDVGKLPYRHPVSQSAISEELVTRARRGQSVVRLEGGDQYVFGRGGEEMLACVEAGLPVRIVPGIIQRPVRAGSLWDPGHPSRGEPVVHGDLRAHPAGAVRARGTGPAGRDDRGTDGDQQPAPDHGRAEPRGPRGRHPRRSSSAVSRPDSAAR